jgi:hypothetical protein
MKILHIISSALIIYCVVFTGLHAGTCSANFFSKPLKTASADSSEVKGTFTVILLGGAHTDDLETVAFLDKEGDQYILEPFAPDFDYKVIKGLSPEEALRETEKFVRFHPSFWKILLNKIIGPEGTIIGFEMKPLYIPFIYGTSDALDIYYWPKKDGRIKVTIRLIPMLETLKFHPGGDGGSGGGH